MNNPPAGMTWRFCGILKQQASIFTSACRAHSPTQQRAFCTLGGLAETFAALEGASSPAIVVVGDVVKAAPHWAAALRSTGETSAVRHGRQR